MASAKQIDAESRRHAEVALQAFRANKRRAFKLVAGELWSKRQAVDALRRVYLKLQKEYLRIPRTTYAGWCDCGPQREWHEVLGASDVDAVWDRLVDTYEERDHG